MFLWRTEHLQTIHARLADSRIRMIEPSYLHKAHGAGGLLLESQAPIPRLCLEQLA